LLFQHTGIPIGTLSSWSKSPLELFGKTEVFERKTPPERNERPALIEELERELVHRPVELDHPPIEIGRSAVQLERMDPIEE